MQRCCALKGFYDKKYFLKTFALVNIRAMNINLSKIRGDGQECC